VGLTEIGFSDHSPMRQDNFDLWRMNRVRLAEYIAKVRQAQKDFPRLTIKLALEGDYLPGQEEWIRELAAIGALRLFSSPATAILEPAPVPF
jgi:histidinol-phosphatase (PHP family)